MSLKNQEKQEKETIKNENRLFEQKVSVSKNYSSNKRNKRAKVNRKSRINKGEVGHIKWHIGSFSNGVLKLKKMDLKKFKK